MVHKTLPKEERIQCRTIIHNNFVRMIVSLCHKVDSLNLQYAQKENQEYANYIKDFFEIHHNIHELSSKECNCLASLWNDSTIQQVFVNHRSEFLETCDYYFANFQRLKTLDFIPNSSDVPRATMKTTGMNASEMTVKGRQVRLVDSGGQVGLP